jgi:hypothetical protein
MNTHELSPQSHFDSLTNSVGDHATAVYLAAFRNLLLPLVRTAMRHGLAHNELVEALRRAIAECAMDLHSGSVTASNMSDSQLAILTGIPRRDAARIKSTLTVGAAEELTNLNRISRLIVGWQRDFVGPYGIPLELPLEPGERSFPDLVRRYAGQVPPEEMLQDLKLVGVVEMTAEGKARLTSSSHITGRLRPEGIERMSWAIHDLAETLDHNLDPARLGPARFERRVYTNEPIDGALLTSFREMATEEAQAFLEKLDNWLNEQFQDLRKKRRKAGTDMIGTTTRPDAKHVGVGVYWLERDKFGA